MDATKTDEKIFGSPETKLHFLDYWRIIRIRKTVILTVFLLVALTTTVVTFLLPKSYSSMVKISIEQEMPDVDAGGRGFLPGYRPTPDPFFLQTEFQRIQSKPVLYRVIEELKLQEQWGRKYKQSGPLTLERTYAILKGSFAVSQSQNTTLVEIKAYSDNKDEAATIANTIAEAYKSERARRHDELVKNGIRVLREQLAEKEAAVSNQNREVNRLRLELGISDSDAASSAPSPTLQNEQLRQINTALFDADARFIDRKSRYQALTNLSREELKQAAPMESQGDSRISELIGQENATQQKLADLLGQQLGSEHPEVKAKTMLLQTVTNQVDKALSGLLISLQNQMEIARASAEHHRTLLNDAYSRDQTNFARTRPYYEAKEELGQKKLIRDKLAMNIDATEIELKTPKLGSVDIMERAEANPEPVRPNKKLNIGLGLGLGLLIGLGLAFFIEYLDTSVKTIDDVERALQAPVLGVIPQNVGILVEEGPDSPHAEAYRVLRTNVLFSRKDPKLNSLTIVSGGAGEGKSTTIFNLATVFAQNGQRVLLVDSDLRRPSLHKYLHLSNSIGLTNFLLKQNTLEEVVQTTSQPNLDFMPSGRLPSSSLGILSSMQMKELIRDVKRRYDFVFFDSPPIMGVSDASILASEVDMVLQVIQYRRYPQPMTIRAKQMIEKVGGNLLGIVLNNINVSQDENYYYYSGYYYDYYNKGEYASDEAEGKKRDKKRADAQGGQTAEAKVEIKSKF
jgi:succinoglycan biosynthesis transport protein ExoP